jgi:polyhydroxybutyrate depolymerase
MSVIRRSTLTLGLLVAACAGGCGSSGQGEKADVGAPSGTGGSATGSGGTGVPGTGGSGESPGTGGAMPGTGGTQDASAVSDAADATPPVPGPDAAAQGPCTTNSLRPGQTTIMIQHGGMTRDYVLHVPPGYTGMSRMPVVVDMHGAGGNASSEFGSGWSQKGDQVGFITIFPHGAGNVFNAGDCCAPTGAPPLQTSTADDTGFIRAVITKTAQDGCIDLRRIYAVGLSNGGLMSYHLACLAADMFTGIAPVSGASVTTPCNPARPVTVVAFRGTMDDLVPYNGGKPRNHTWPSAKADFELWAKLDQCTGTPTASRGVCQTYGQCAGGVEVTLCSVVGGHVLYGQAAASGLAVPTTAWEIFQRHAPP